MPRMAHHRATNRKGPESRWLQRKTYHLAKVLKPLSTGAAMADSMVCMGTGLYRIPPSRVAEWRAALEDALPYLRDEDGRVWE
jgi:hypothetical protein